MDMPIDIPFPFSFLSLSRSLWLNFVKLFFVRIYAIILCIFVCVVFTIYYTFAGYRLPKGRPVFIHINNIQRSPAEFDEPDAFKPSRWLEPDGGAKKSAEFGFIPFGAGHRRCLAEHYSTPQLVTIVAMIVRRFRFNMENPSQFVPATYKTSWLPIQPKISFRLAA